MKKNWAEKEGEEDKDNTEPWLNTVKSGRLCGSAT